MVTTVTILDKVLIVMGLCLLVAALVAVPSDLFAQGSGAPQCPATCNDGCTQGAPPCVPNSGCNGDVGCGSCVCKKFGQNNCVCGVN
jgi:hypothetical protein